MASSRVWARVTLYIVIVLALFPTFEGCYEGEHGHSKGRWGPSIGVRIFNSINEKQENPNPTP